MSEGLDDRTVRDVGAALGVRNCTRAKLDTVLASSSASERAAFESCTNEKRGYEAATFLNVLDGTSVNGVGQDKNEIRSLRKHFIALGLGPTGAAWYHHIIGQLAAYGYQEIDPRRRVILPLDTAPHEGYRNESWTFRATSTAGDVSFEIQLRRCSITPPAAWSAGPPQMVWQVLLSVNETNNLHSVLALPGELGLVSVANEPFDIAVGSILTVRGTNEPFPIAVDFRDPNTLQEISVTLVTKGLSDGLFGTDCLGCSHGMGFQGYGYEYEWSGTVNGVQTEGAGTFRHEWESGMYPLGYRTTFTERTTTVFPYRAGKIPSPGRWIRVEARINLYAVEAVWLGSPYGPLDRESTTGSSVYCTVTHTGVSKRVHATMTAINWVQQADGSTYPYGVTLAVPEFEGALEFDVAVNQFINFGTADVPVLEYDGRTPVSGLWLDKRIAPNSVGWMSMDTTLNADQLARRTALMVDYVPRGGRLDALRFPRPSAGDAARVFFYWFVPAVVVILIVVALVFVFDRVTGRGQTPPHVFN